MTRILYLATIICLTSIYLCGCSGKNSAPVSKDSVDVAISEDTSYSYYELPVDLKLHFEVVNKSIADGDAKKFASLLFYPIRRDYPLRWIEDSAQMVAEFPSIIDDSLRNLFKKARPEDWDGGGWRGYSIGDCDFWDDGRGIYMINYYSKSELQRREKLVKEEMSTLHPSLRGKDFDPFACYYDDKTHAIMRLDWKVKKDNYDFYRMCVYKDYRKLRERPDMILDVKRDVQGTAALQWFECSQEVNGKKKLVMEFYVDYTERYDGFDATVYKENKTENHTLYRVYWLDLVNGRKKL